MNDSVPQIKVGDKVSRTPVLASNEDVVYYRVKSVELATNSFETDPNGPFEKGWKGRLSDHKPHYLYPGYWVPATKGLTVNIHKARLKVSAAGIKNTRQPTVKAQIDSTIVKKEYQLDMNWYGRAFGLKVKAQSEDQALVVAALHLSNTHIKNNTAASIYQYLVHNKNKVSIAQIG